MTLLVVDWSSVLDIAGTGLLLVFVMLILLVFVMKLFGYAFKAKKQILAPIISQEPEELPEEEIAAITVAIKLYKQAYRSNQKYALTINRMARVYSPWNSKIHSLTQMPERH